MRKESYRPEIDGLRAIAVIFVVGYHYGLVNSIFKSGFVGVDIFFVISGYLITQILTATFGQEKWLFNFYLRRIRRIFPALILVMAMTLVIGFLILLPFELRELGRQILSGSLFSSNLYFWSQTGYFDSAASQKPLLHLWSLGVEEQFYIIYPLAIYTVIRFRKRLRESLISIFLISFFFSIFVSANSPAMSYYAPFSRAWELALGGIASTFVVNTTAVRHTIIRFVGIVLFVLGLYSVEVQNSYPNFTTFLPTLGTALILISVSSSDMMGKLLSIRPMVFIGKLSYSLYLWHWPLLSFFVIYMGYPPNRLDKYLLLLLAVSLSFVTFKFVEQPSLKFGRTGTVAICMGLVLISSAGLLVAQSSGFPSRIATQNMSQVSQGDINNQFYSVDFSNPECLNDFPNPQAIGYQWWFCKSTSSSPEVLLWGNSYANQYFHGLSSSSNYKGVGILSIGDCPIQREEELTPPNPCAGSLFDEQRVFLKRLIENNKSIETVIVAGLKEKPSEDDLNDLKDALTFLNREGKDVIVFYPHIKPPEVIFGCVSRPLRKAAWNCKLTNLEYSKLIEDFKPTLNTIREDYPNVQIFNPNDAFCTDKGCSFMISGLPIIRDGSGHISDWGSELVAKEFASWLSARNSTLLRMTS